MPKTKFSILLAKPGVTIAQTLRNLKPAPKETILGDARFYHKKTVANKPKWLKDFFSDTIADPSLSTKTIQAVLLKEIQVTPDEKRVFAITFGFGRNLLDTDKFEERFGINTALNLISAKELRSIDSNTLGKTPRSQHVQIDRDAEITDFDLDSEYDLLKSVCGKVDASAIGAQPDLAGINSVSGRSSLSLSKEITYDKIDPMLRQLYATFRSNAYRQKFPDIDLILELRDKASIDALTLELVRLLNADPLDETDIRVSIPEMIEWANVSGFSYGPGDQTHTELELADLVTYLKKRNKGNPIDYDILKRYRIDCIDANGNRGKGWPLKNSLSAEIRLNGCQYILNEGKWYKFDDDYIRQINDYINRVQYWTGQLPSCGKKEAEKDYNRRVCDANAGYIHLDCELQRPDGKSPVEVCDIFTPDKEYIHVKKCRGAPDLSHLFNQGFISGEILLNYPASRQKLIADKPEMAQYIDPDAYRAGDYTVIFGIITDKPGPKLDFPLFSKISFRSVARRLTSMGYRVLLHPIPWQ